MKKAVILLMSALLLLLATGVAAQQPDKKGCNDHPLFPTRMPDYRIGDCKVEAFGVYEFFVTKGPKIPVEGKLPSSAIISPESGPTNRAVSPLSGTTRTPSGKWEARSCRAIRRGG